MDQSESFLSSTELVKASYTCYIDQGSRRLKKETKIASTFTTGLNLSNFDHFSN